MRGIAFNSKDAHALAEFAGESEWVKWHVKSYELGLENGLPVLRSWPRGDRHAELRGRVKKGPSLRQPVPVWSFETLPPGRFSARIATKSPILNSSLFRPRKGC